MGLPSGSGVPNTVIKTSKRTITEVTYYELTGDELDKLEQAIGASRDSLTFASIALGILVTSIGTLATFDVTTHWFKWNVFLILLFASLVFTIWFGIIYFRERKQVKTVLDRIRNPQEK